MRSRSFVLPLLVALLLVGVANGMTSKKTVVPNVFIVGLKKKSSSMTMQSMIASVKSALESEHCTCRIIKMSRKLGFVVIRTNVNDTNIVKKILDKKKVPYTYVEHAHYVYTTYIPNDPLFKNQWGPKDINLTKAWDITLGNDTIIVAVVDTGIDYTHPDIAAHYLPLGYDIVNNDPDPLDDNGHGTHCAGIIAAVINNSIGIAGTANVKLIAEKVLAANGTGTDYDVALGIQYAVDNGSKVISMSLGGPLPSITLQNAVQYAWSKGAVLVAASGNDGLATIDYPAAYPEVIAVGAINESNQLAWFSNYGKEQELVAPGVNILSTMPTYPVYLNTTYGVPLDYANLSGTSMATPFVAGVAALTWATHPTATNAQIRYILNHTAIDLGAPGWDIYYGYGKVDAYKAITYGLQIIPIGFRDYGVDTNGDGVYDYLEINMSVYTVVPDNYTITADLIENTTGTPVYSFFVTANLTQGKGYVTFDVPGNVIASTNYNGSYDLVNLVISNSTSVVYSKVKAYTTSSYNYTAFVVITPPVPEVPTIVLLTVGLIGVLLGIVRRWIR